MKVLVAVKRVIDPYVKIRIKPDHSGVETQQVKMSMNPFDEIAVEEALRLRESGKASEIILVSIGTEVVADTLRHGLALGADQAILVRTEQAHCPLNLAKILRAVVAEIQPGLVLMGKQSIDGDNNQTPQMLAGLLDWPQATYASEIQIEGNEAQVVREIDGGLETLALTLPAVVSTDLRLNQPRYASLPNIMKARQKPLRTIELDTLGLDLSQHIRQISITPPPTRQAGIRVNSVEELLHKLRHEAGVL